MQKKMEETPNPNNLPVLDIKILVAGEEDSGQMKLIEQYGAVDGGNSTGEYYIKEISLEDEFYILNIEFYEPKQKDIAPYAVMYEKACRESKFDGVIMVCAHKEIEGEFLKSSINYLGEL